MLKSFPTYETEFVLFFAVLEHGLRQLTRDTISDVSCLQTFLKRCNEKLQMTFGVGHHTTLIVNSLFKTSIFPVIGKKNNQSSVSDADREIQSLLNLISGIVSLPLGWDFSGCIGDP